MYSHRSTARPLSAALLLAALLVAPAAANADVTANSGSALERLLLTEPAKIGTMTVEAGPLRSLYQARKFAPLWSAGPRRDTLLAVLNAAPRDGLDGYVGAAITERLGAAAGDPKAMELDVLLTDALLRYADDLSQGRVEPDDADHLWQHRRPDVDTAAMVRSLVEGDDLQAALDALAPAYAEYRKLRDVLPRLRDLQKAGGWPQVPEVGKDSIKPGMEHAEVIPAVRKRLTVTGEFTGADKDSPKLDDELSEAVKRFQATHGLDADGVVGRSTAAAMSITIDQRIEQVIANLERWRWLPRKLEPLHLFVNIGGQELRLVKDGQTLLQTRVVVGKPTHRTVAFKAAVSSITLNPPWNVPDSIATKEILPELKRNPDYLVENRLKIVGAFPSDTPESEGLGIDWHSYSRFPYQLRQVPGRDNSLGVVKFNMPNANDIYLHDTPSKGLFSRARRAFSHGCVRVQDPVRLAATLIGKEDYTPEKIKQRIDSGQTQTVHLSQPIPIYLFYFTAWVDGDGVLQVRDDIYGYDRGISSQLAKMRQKSVQAAKN